MIFIPSILCLCMTAISLFYQKQSKKSLPKYSTTLSTNLTRFTTYCSFKIWQLRTNPCLYTEICLCVMSYDIIMSWTWEFWWKLVGNPLVLAPNKKYNDLFLSSFHLDCHHQVGMYPKLGNWWFLSKLDDYLSVEKPVDLINSIWLSHCFRQCWCNTPDTIHLNPFCIRLSSEFDSF